MRNKTWIVVADERAALVYRGNGPRTPFDLQHTLENEGDRPDRELESDRPGRAFSSSTGQRHGIDGERSTRRTRQAGFAKRIADEIDRARQAGEVRRLVLMSGPRMLGLLRAALPAASQALLVAEVPKDLVQLDEPAIRSHVPIETWWERHARR